MTSKADVDRWRALADAAASGKWYATHNKYESGIERRKFGRSRHVWMGYDSAFPSNATLAFIAASREAVPAMADMLAEAAALLAAWYEVGGDIEDGVSVSLPTREWLTEWREEAADDA